MESPEQNSTPDYSTDELLEGLDAEIRQLMARVEALLFVAPGSVEVSRLSTALDASQRKVERALEALELTYQKRGLALQRNRQGLQLTTSPDLSEEVERFLELESTGRLTKAALEVLAVVAYQQPVTRPYVDSIRGVNSDSALRTLMRYGLIEEVGRTDAPGRPILYATTPDFFQYFGLRSMEELPPLNLEEQLPESPHPDAEERATAGEGAE